VAVRADDITLCRLFEKLRATLEQRLPRTQAELLLAWVSMIEIHLMRGKPAAAIGARHLAKLTKEGGGGLLASSNAIDL
jgi:hypothetical protein